jgi:hypothetical protein
MICDECGTIIDSESQVVIRNLETEKGHPIKHLCLHCLQTTVARKQSETLWRGNQ